MIQEIEFYNGIRLSESFNGFTLFTIFLKKNMNRIWAAVILMNPFIFYPLNLTFHLLEIIEVTNENNLKIQVDYKVY